jgi:type IV pilus assembly protein PilA
LFQRNTASQRAIRANHINAGARRRSQGGFTLIELTIVGIILGVLTLLALPRINSFLIDRKVQPTATDLAQAVMRVRVNAEGTGATPYTGMNTAALANTLRGRTTVLTVNGSGATANMTHGLGRTGATVTAAPTTITVTGDSWTATASTVNAAACPGLAASLRTAAEIITINGEVVHSIPAGTAFNGQTAQNFCTDGDTNTFTFTFR